MFSFQHEMVTPPPNPLYTTNFANLLGRAAGLFGDKSAIIARDAGSSFSELSHRSVAITTALKASRIEVGDRCAVLIRNPVDAAAAFFAVLACGGIGINVNELYRPRQIEHVLRHSRARLLITSDDDLRAQPRSVDTTAHILSVT